MTHATTVDLELFVSSRLDEERSAWLERHCEECETCARAVAEESRLELTLRAMSGDRRCGMRADAVAPSFAAPPRPQRFYAVAAAAALAFAFAVIGHVPRTQVQQPSAVFADAGDLAKSPSPVPAWAAGEPSGGTP